MFLAQTEGQQTDLQAAVVQAGENIKRIFWIIVIVTVLVLLFMYLKK